MRAEHLRLFEPFQLSGPLAVPVHAIAACSDEPLRRSCLRARGPRVPLVTAQRGRHNAPIAVRPAMSHRRLRGPEVRQSHDARVFYDGSVLSGLPRRLPKSISVPPSCETGPSAGCRNGWSPVNVYLSSRPRRCGRLRLRLAIGGIRKDRHLQGAFGGGMKRAHRPLGQSFREAVVLGRPGLTRGSS